MQSNNNNDVPEALKLYVKHMTNAKIEPNEKAKARAQILSMDFKML